MAATKNRGLGKGLGALIADANESVSIDAAKHEILTASQNVVLFIDINSIKPNANQPRKQFNEEKIEELADSIRTHGIIQPVVVRHAENGYEIVAGERRWRAARRADLREIPCLVKELTDEQNMVLAIIENMQREDLNPMEESEAINQMISAFGLTQDEISKSIGKSRPYITNALRLLKLPDEIQALVSEGKLSAGHARAIVTIADPKKQMDLAEKAVRDELSVREIEKLANQAKPQKKSTAAKRRRSADVAAVEEELKAILGTKVKLNLLGKKGRIEIEYYSKDELERLLDLLKTLA